MPVVPLGRRLRKGGQAHAPHDRRRPGEPVQASQHISHGAGELNSVILLCHSIIHCFTCMYMTSCVFTMQAQAAGAQANGSQHAKSAPAAATTNGGADDSFWDQASSSNQVRRAVTVL